MHSRLDGEKLATEYCIDDLLPALMSAKTHFTQSPICTRHHSIYVEYVISLPELGVSLHFR
jgi:hypothetical protein